MGCTGCGSKTRVFTQTNTTGITEHAPMKQTGQTVPEAVCLRMYDDLFNLERKVVNLYNKFRLETGGKWSYYLAKQRQIRAWIVDLKNGCPPDEEYMALRKEIGSDFKNLF